jgi:hypothetical protein
LFHGNHHSLAVYPAIKPYSRTTIFQPVVSHVFCTLSPLIFQAGCCSSPQDQSRPDGAGKSVLKYFSERIDLGVIRFPV